MIFDIRSIQFEDSDWINILIQYLNGWTEIPLTTAEGYNLDELKFYDGFIGYLLKQTERYLKECPNEVDMDFINSWKYKGKLYRVIHQSRRKDETLKKGYSCRLPKIKYHGMISHWTDDYTFEGLMYKLNHEEKYIILEADTKDHLGFNVNKFRKVYNCENSYTSKEREIIFPMYKDCIIKEHRMSIEEFTELKKNSSNF